MRLKKKLWTRRKVKILFKISPFIFLIKYHKQEFCNGFYISCQFSWILKWWYHDNMGNMEPCSIFWVFYEKEMDSYIVVYHTAYVLSNPLIWQVELISPISIHHIAERSEISCDFGIFCNLLLEYVTCILRIWNVNGFRLIKEYDREIKDEEGRNPPEVNKQLNDEKQSMVSTWNAFLFFLAHVENLVSNFSKFERGTRSYMFRIGILAYSVWHVRLYK